MLLTAIIQFLNKQNKCKEIRISHFFILGISIFLFNCTVEEKVLIKSVKTDIDELDYLLVQDTFIVGEEDYESFSTFLYQRYNFLRDANFPFINLENLYKENLYKKNGIIYKKIYACPNFKHWNPRKSKLSDIFFTYKNEINTLSNIIIIHRVTMAHGQFGSSPISHCFILTGILDKNGELEK